MQWNAFTGVLLQLDAPISIELPPKETKSSDRRRALQQPRSSARSAPCSNSSAASTSVKRGRSLAVTADYLASWKNRSATDGHFWFFLFFCDISLPLSLSVGDLITYVTEREAFLTSHWCFEVRLMEDYFRLSIFYKGSTCGHWYTLDLCMLLYIYGVCLQMIALATCLH